MAFGKPAELQGVSPGHMPGGAAQLVQTWTCYGSETHLSFCPCDPRFTGKEMGHMAGQWPRPATTPTARSEPQASRESDLKGRRMRGCR